MVTITNAALAGSVKKPEISLLEQHGFNVDMINDAYDLCQTIPQLDSVHVIRHGELLIDWYFHEGGIDVSYEILSAAKSIFSIIFGIACDQGRCPLYEVD